MKTFVFNSNIGLTNITQRRSCVLTCSPSAEGSDSVITLDVSAIFLFLPLFFAVSGGLSLILQREQE